jgi:hypothetical protein
MTEPRPAGLPGTGAAAAPCGKAGSAPFKAAPTPDHKCNH